MSIHIATILTICVIQCASTLAEGQLTVQQTVGSVFLVSNDLDADSRIAALAKANPDATAILYQLLDSPNLKVEFRINAYLALSFINTEREVRYFSHVLDAYKNKQLGKEQLDLIQTISICLGNMSHNGNVGATTMIREISHIAFWEQLGIRVVSGNAILAQWPEHDLMFRVFLGLAGSTLDDRQEILSKYVDSLPVDLPAEPARYIKSYFDISVLKRFWEDFRRKSDAPVSDDVLVLLPTLFNQNFDHPDRLTFAKDAGDAMGRQPNSSPNGDALKAGNGAVPPSIRFDDFDALREATSHVFEEIVASLLENDADKRLRHLLDDGEPIKDRMIDRDEFRLAIEQQREFVSAFADGLELRAMQVFVDGDPTLAGQEIAPEESLVVVFSVANSKEIVERFNLIAGFSVGNDGELLVYLRLIGDQWYWNPFGW